MGSHGIGVKVSGMRGWKEREMEKWKDRFRYVTSRRTGRKLGMLG